MKKFHYYLSVLISFIRFSLISRLTYRASSISNIVDTVFRVGVIFIFLSVVFSKVHSVGDWTQPQILLFYGVFLLATSLFDMFIGRNLNQIQDYVESGDLDFILTKPINPLFLLSFKDMEPFHYPDLLVALAVIFFAISAGHFQIVPVYLVLSLVLLLFGFIIYYAIYLIMAVVSFWTTHTPFTELVDTISSIMRFPLNIFGKALETIFTFFLPLIFVVTVPTKALLGIFDYLVFLAPIIALALLFLATSFWNFAIKQYSSASS